MAGGSDESSGLVLLTGNSHPQLSELVSTRLGIRLGDAIVYNKTNRETNVDVRQVKFFKLFFNINICLFIF
jgi:phosphoribosylpyrophosphate synthetase